MEEEEGGTVDVDGWQWFARAAHDDASRPVIRQGRELRTMTREKMRRGTRRTIPHWMIVEVRQTNSQRPFLPAKAEKSDPAPCRHDIILIRVIVPFLSRFNPLALGPPKSVEDRRGWSEEKNSGRGERTANQVLGKK